MSHEFLTSFFGWMAVLNIAMLTLGALTILVMKEWAAGLHARLFNLDEAVVRQAMYAWLGNYKVATLVFSVMPYLALRLM